MCGGQGTRLSEETQIKPKPMVEIGERPILWHIMKIYERHGLNDFILALGYKGNVIKDYFLRYHARQTNVTIHLKTGEVQYSNPTAEDWRVALVDTGAQTMTGGRLLRLASELLPLGSPLCLYGPFKRGGSHTAASNESFDQMLRSRDPAWGVRDLEEVERAAGEVHLSLDQVIEMPANNWVVVFRK